MPHTTSKRRAGTSGRRCILFVGPLAWAGHSPSRAGEGRPHLTSDGDSAANAASFPRPWGSSVPIVERGHEGDAVIVAGRKLNEA